MDMNLYLNLSTKGSGTQSNPHQNQDFGFPRKGGRKGLHVDVRHGREAREGAHLSAENSPNAPTS